MYGLIRVRFYNLLHSPTLSVAIITLIVLNILAVMLETIDEMSFMENFFEAFELFSVIVFTVEYLLRLWTCTVGSKSSHPLLGRISYALTPLMLVDLAAVLPFYMPFMFLMDLRVVRALRLFRLLRIFKISRYSQSLRLIGRVLINRKEELSISLFAVTVLLVTVSSLMYFFENETQPDAFSSIPAAMWWGVATLTTVGYGDVYPVTPMGKILGALVAVLGIGMFALPTGIIGAGFVEEMQKSRGAGGVCPYCGRAN